MSRRALGVLSPNSERPATLPSKHSASQAVVSKETVTEVAVREYQQDRNFTATIPVWYCGSTTLDAGNQITPKQRRILASTAMDRIKEAEGHSKKPTDLVINSEGMTSYEVGPGKGDATFFAVDAGDMQYVLSGQQQSSGAADDVKVCIIIFCGSKAPSKELKATQCHLLRLRKEDHAVTRPALFGNINRMLRNSMFSALFDKHADQLQADMEHTVERISSLMQDELTHAMERVDHIMRDSRC